MLLVFAWTRKQAFTHISFTSCAFKHNCGSSGKAPYDLRFDASYKASMSLAVPALLDIKILDLDPLDTECFASTSDYSKGENITPAKACIQLMSCFALVSCCLLRMHVLKVQQQV